MVCFSRASVRLNYGQLILIEEGRMSWDLGLTFRTRIPPHYFGEIGRFGFAPRRHGIANIFLSYESCEL